MLAAIDRWIFGAYPASARDLAVYRILFAALTSVSVLPTGRWLEDAPEFFFNPPVGIAALFPAPAPFPVIVALNAILWVSLALLLVGWKTRASSIAVSASLLLLQSWTFAQGKINHNILLLAVPAVMAFSGWGRRYSLDARRQQTAADHENGSWPVSLLVLMIGLAMFSAGWAKASSGWFDPGQHAVLGHLVRNHYVTGRETWLGSWLLTNTPFWAWKPLDWFTVLMEMAFLPAVVYRPAFRLAVAAACVFHVVVWFSFAIVFWANVLAYGILVPFTRFRPLAKLVEWAAAFGSRRYVPVLPGALALAPAWFLFHHFIPLPIGPGRLVLATGLVVSVAWIARSLGVALPVRVARGSEPSLVLFDGVCNLCNGWVDFLLRRDKRRRLRFASLQSEPVRQLLTRFGLDPDAMGSIIVVRDGQVWRRSDAVAQVVAELGFPYNVAGLFRVVPRPLRDAVYRLVAKHRYNWFGRRDTCRLPSPEERAQFWPQPG